MDFLIETALRVFTMSSIEYLPWGYLMVIGKKSKFFNSAGYEQISRAKKTAYEKIIDGDQGYSFLSCKIIQC